jgi:type I restriction enzyme S subunit
VPEDIPTAINTKHICAVTPDRSLVLPEFIRAAFLWHPASLRHLKQQAKGSIMDGLNMGIIKSLPLPVPPLTDQRLFTERVGSVKAVRAKAQRARAGDDEFFASLQSRAFRGEL